MRPSANTGRTTTEPGCVTISRVASTPPGSITLSRRTPKTRPSKTILLLRTFAKALRLATESPSVETRHRHSTAGLFTRLDERFLAAPVPVAYTDAANHAHQYSHRRRRAPRARRAHLPAERFSRNKRNRSGQERPRSRRAHQGTRTRPGVS